MDYTRTLDEVFSQFKGPAFAIRLWDSVVRTYGQPGTPQFTLVMDSPRVATRLLAEGALGFGESYMEGSLRIEGDLEAYLRMRHQFKHVRPSLRLWLATLYARLTSPFTRKAQIAKHYDLGNEFFERLLDPETMSYSAGLYEGAEKPLPDAQGSKLDYIMGLLSLPGGSRVLDLGAGWGGFAMRAAGSGLIVTGYTISDAQLSFARDRVIHSAGPGTIALEHRDMLGSLPQGAFEAVVSIESIEHVGKENLPNYFRSVFDALTPGGSFYIQCTGRYVPRRVDAWTIKYVFPGGYLPPKDELIQSAKDAGFDIALFKDDTDDYVRTMTAWIANLERNRDYIEKRYGASFYRLWELWMHGAKVAFEVGSMSLFRIHVQKP